MEKPETRTLNWERGLRSDDEDEIDVWESAWRVETHMEKAGKGESSWQKTMLLEELKDRAENAFTVLLRENWVIDWCRLLMVCAVRLRSF
jgi:hypothetical protein